MSPLGRELLRKLVHVGSGCFALGLRWLAPLPAALCALAALLFNLLLLHPLTRGGLLREAERGRAFSWGTALYPAAVLGAILAFHDRLELAAGTWALLAWGDGMAAVSGLLLGGRPLPWNVRKTWVGLVAFVVYGTLAAAWLVRFTQHGALGRGTAPTSIGGAFLDDGAGGTLISAPVLLLLGCALAAVVAGLFESLPSGIDDNLVVPLAGGVALWAAASIVPARIVAAAPALAAGFGLGALVSISFAGAAWWLGGVGTTGAVGGALLGTVLYACAGWRGFLLLVAFFALGTACTRLGWARKVALGVAQERGGRRGARHAVANVSAAVVCSALAVATPHREAFTWALAAALAAAAADTVSSEIGQAFGSRHVLITTLRRVRAGTEGAISPEGTLAGMAAAALLGAVAASVGSISWMGAGVVAAAGFAGAMLESCATALAGRELDNEVINFANTVAGAALAGAVHASLS
ncbi:MAG TPA: DUF92 domain-containing protein [Candidatus Polarisedimenticolaceae bacterium]|nr:DUF92 domain-containing protein [Candidatus Polarisedimenticolaceae bacterium]